MTYFIKTFGCSTNTADSERVAAVLERRGYKKARSIKFADYVVINTCMIRESAENRVYGLLNNLEKLKIKNKKLKIILTGCMVGMAIRDETGKFMRRLREKFSMVDEFLPMEEIGFDPPLRGEADHALVPISNGCNNFCTYCVVPYTRGREISRPFTDIISECEQLRKSGYKQITLLGQNVNSYGKDLRTPLRGRVRLSATNFASLLETVAKIGFEKVDFISSNPQDFSKELINVIAKNKNISREIHLPLQSGDDEILKKMNRRYTCDQYLKLVQGLRSKIKDLKLSTDVIVGFPTETEEQFQNTVKLCKKVGFFKAYIS